MKSAHAVAICIFTLVLNTVAAPPVPSGKEVPLFDGKSLTGWEGNATLWQAKDGMIVGGSLEQTVPRNEFIATTKSYHNFELRLKIRIRGSEGFINSGVQIRSVRVPNNSEMSGYQVDAGDGWWGKLYDESRRNKVVGEAKDLKAINDSIKKGDWNEYVIRANGPRLQSWINGLDALDYTEADPNIAQDGRIGIQVHGGGKTVVEVKDITIEELPPTPGAPTWDKVGRPGEKKPKALKEGNAGAAPRTPEEEQAAFQLPEGFEIELVAAENPAEGIGKFVCLDFDQQGRLWTTTALEYPVDGNENPAAAESLYQSHAKDKVLVFDTPFAEGVQKPRVFADGLAIPLGVLAYKDGCYVQHGHDIAFFRDTDGDGKADKHEVVLTGFGVQDSHLFPHQFTRAPGGWLWMAQGAFNYGKVFRPGEKPENGVKFDQTRMAKFRPDGREFTITSQGPCNIWGLVISGTGEAFIQEANDYGYPVMPFHEFANYPGCSDSQWKSYAPEFPGTAPNFRMGGTGLSGLALTDATGPFPEPWRDVMLVANPITNKVNAIRMHREGTGWRLEKLNDFVATTDAWFRPVAIAMGPDGNLYIVDWYNKIISHNEVPRNHPDRDKTRGRIWRVKAKGAKPIRVPDFTKAEASVLVDVLRTHSPLAQRHLAWQSIVDRQLKDTAPELMKINDPALRIPALWAMEGLQSVTLEMLAQLLKDPDRNVRREAVRMSGEISDPLEQSNWGATEKLIIDHPKDADPQVRAEVVRRLARSLDSFEGFPVYPSGWERTMRAILSMADGPLAEPKGKSTNSGRVIKVGVAYEREFERYLVRLSLERHPAMTARFLDLADAATLPVEARLLASLALSPKESAGRVAKLLPQLQRPPEKEEILRLVQFIDEPGVGDALKASLANPITADAVLNALLEVRTRVDLAKRGPLVNDAAAALLRGGGPGVGKGIQLVAGFKLSQLESEMVKLVEGADQARAVEALRALAEIGSTDTTLFAKLASGAKDSPVRDEALAALASAKAPDAPEKVMNLWPGLDAAQRRIALDRLTTTKPGAKTVVAAVLKGSIAKETLDAAILDRLQAVLGENDPDLATLLPQLAGLFRPVLMLDGKSNAYTETGLTLTGPLTVETWVRLEPGIDNSDGILGSPGQVDLNFFGGLFRVWAGAAAHDVAIARKAMTPGLWTHVAATRNGEGRWKIYVDGELDASGSKQAAHPLENVRIGWTAPANGTHGALCEFRIWDRERTADEIRANFDRSIPVSKGDPSAPIFCANENGTWGKTHSGAKVVRTTDVPPILTPDQAAVLDGKFAKYRALAAKPGDAGKGKQIAVMCQACHLMGAQGGNIGPNLSGVGAMGTEAILRNILTPNAAMESAYRVYRVEGRDGTVLDTFFVSEDKDAVVVRMPGVADRRIARKDIARTTFIRRSLMPEGLLDGLTQEQVSDLFAYLQTLK